MTNDTSNRTSVQAWLNRSNGSSVATVRSSQRCILYSFHSESI
jgi:hypothetical protein